MAGWPRLSGFVAAPALGRVLLRRTVPADSITKRLVPKPPCALGMHWHGRTSAMPRTLSAPILAVVLAGTAAAQTAAGLPPASLAKQVEITANDRPSLAVLERCGQPDLSKSYERVRVAALQACGATQAQLRQIMAKPSGAAAPANCSTVKDTAEAVRQAIKRLEQSIKIMEAAKAASLQPNCD